MLDAFFFFIAGISPKVKVLDEKPRRCPVCGLHQAGKRDRVLAGSCGVNRLAHDPTPRGLCQQTAAGAGQDDGQCLDPVTLTPRARYPLL